MGESDAEAVLAPLSLHDSCKQLGVCFLLDVPVVRRGYPLYYYFY